jgi:hypothetical protein
MLLSGVFFLTSPQMLLHTDVVHGCLETCMCIRERVKAPAHGRGALRHTCAFVNE